MPFRRCGFVAVLSALAALAVAGCAKKKDDRGQKDAAPPLRLDAALPPAPGLVYFAVSREGVVELKGGVFRRVIASQGRIDDLAVAPNGDVFAVADAQIFRAAAGASEDEAELVGNRSAPGVARRIAAGADGRLWAISGKGLWVRSAGEWTVDNTFPRPRTVVDIVATRGGRVVAAARDAAFIREEGGDEVTWRPLELPEPPPEPKEPPSGDAGATAEDGVSDDGVDEEGSSKRGTFVRELALGADDRVYASTSSGVYLLGDAEWTRVAQQPVGALAIAADATIVAAAESGGVLWGAANQLHERELGSLGIAASELDAIATDSLSRVWLASDGGLVLAAGSADPLAAYSAGSVAHLPGRIVAIRVIDAPTILPEISERRHGAVRGRLVSTDPKAVAGVDVELCARPDTMFSGSPCAESPVRGVAKTDAKGAFRVDELPAGRYGVAIRSGKEWTVDLTIDCCVQLFAEDEVSLKRIRLERYD